MREGYGRDEDRRRGGVVAAGDVGGTQDGEARGERAKAERQQRHTQQDAGDDYTQEHYNSKGSNGSGRAAGEPGRATGGGTSASGGSTGSSAGKGPFGNRGVGAGNTRGLQLLGGEGGGGGER